MGSWLAVGGNSLILIGKALGHSQPSTTQIYARLHEGPVGGALDRHRAQLMEIARAKQNPAAKVVKAPAQRARSHA